MTKPTARQSGRPVLLGPGRRPWFLPAIVLLLAVFALVVPLPTAVVQERAPVDKPAAMARTDDSTVESLDDGLHEKTIEGAPEDLPGLGTPKATIVVFLNAMDDADQGRVERYTDAVACLDLSGLAGLPDAARMRQGRELATLLHEFISQRGVELDRVPEAAAAGPYTLHRRPDGGPAIQIRQFDDGRWRFTWASLVFVESLHPEAPEQAPVPEGGVAPASAEAPPASRKDPLAELPEEFRSARATMRTFRDAMEQNRAGDAAQCLDLSRLPVGVRGEAGSDRADVLYRAILRARPVVLAEFSDDPEGRRHIVWQDEQGRAIVIDRQGKDDDRPGEWLFTADTVAGIEDLYEGLLESGARARGLAEVEQPPFKLSVWLRENLPRPLKEPELLLRPYQWLGLVVLVFAGLLAYRVTMRLLYAAAALWFTRQGVTVGEAVQRGSFRPVGLLAVSAVWWIGLTVLALRPEVLAVLLIAVKVVACVMTVWTFYRAVDLAGDYFTSLAEKTRTTIDDLLVPLLRKVAKTVITILGILFIIRQFTEHPPTELLAGLGLGGLAVALAAQDTLKNLFGSLTVILDRPFKVGDWVEIGDVDGTVESVGFRSTRIRTFYNSQVVVPNSSLSNATVDNYGARRYRRIKVMISVTYQTPPGMIDAFCEGIRELIRLHPYTRKDYYHVYLNKFGASSLDLLLYCFLETPDWGTELRERHRLFIDILRLAEKLGVNFAFPTHTVWLQREGDVVRAGQRASFMPAVEDADSLGVSRAAKVFEEAYGGERATPRGPVMIDPTPRSKHKPSS